MPLPLSGPISFNNINVELGVAGTTQASLGQASYRTLAGVPSGAISMSNFYGKANEIVVTFSTSTLNATVNINSLPGYSAGSANIRIVINSGVYLWSDSSTPGLTLTGGAAGDTINIVNNGFIMGRGGNGTIFDSGLNIAVNQTPGYDAISISRPVTINNQSGYIGGGGGAGGASAFFAAGGGGAGGGAGGYIQGGKSGGDGGAIGQSGTNGGAPSNSTNGGGGGRLIPGLSRSGPTTSTFGGIGGFGGQAGGSGAVGGLDVKGNRNGGAGGGGGGWGANGGTAIETNSTTGTLTLTGGTGGASNQAGGNGTSNVSTSASFPGTAGGKAIRTNGHAVTWVGGSASSSRSFGAVS